MSKDGYFLVRRGSTAVSNKLIHDKSLSYATLGVLMACLAMPDEAVKGYRQLTGRGLGEHATRRALRELEDHRLRFRFRVRSGGRLRDVVIVSDAPIEVDEAMGIVVAAMKDGTMTSGPIVDCPSHPGFFPEKTAKNAVGPDCAAASAAQKSDPVDNSDTVRRQTAAQSAAAHIPKGISNDSSLRSESPTIQPAVAMDASVVGVGEENRGIGAGRCPAGAPPAGPPGLEPSARPASEDEWRLAAESLPPEMLGVMTKRAAARVAADLRRAISGGWTMGQVRSRLAANPLPPPDQVRNLVGLIISRVAELADSRPPVAQAPVRPPRPLRVVGEPREEMTGVERAELVKRLRGNTALPSGMRAQLADRLENSSVPGLFHPVSGEDSPFQGRERKPDGPTKGARKKAQG